MYMLRGGRGRWELWGARVKRLAPPTLSLAITLQALAAFWAVWEPLYIIHGPVEGKVYALRATLTYMGVEWIPGPLASALAVYMVGLGVLAVGWASSVAGLVVDARYSRLGGYLAVIGFSIILGGYTLVGYALQPFQEHLVFETNFGVIDMGASTVERGPPAYVLARVKTVWPLLALLTLILAELSIEDHGG